MQRNHPLARILAQIAFGALLVAGSIPSLQAADASGTWTWSTPGRDGGEARKSTLKLKAEGEKLTGTLKSPGRQGGEGRDIEISDGKIKGDDVSFAVVREVQGNKRTTKFAGKISGDTIKGKIEMEQRDGNTRSIDWEPKRETK